MTLWTVNHGLSTLWRLESRSNPNTSQKANTYLVLRKRFKPNGTIVAVQLLSHVQQCASPGTAARQASLSFTISWNLSNSCPLSQWCRPTISSSVVPFSSCLQSFPASGSFPVNQFFTSGGQNMGASASVLPMNTHSWFPLRLTGLISFQFKGLSRVFSNTTIQKHQFFSAQPFLWSSSHIHTWLRGKPYLTRWTFVGKLTSLHFNMLSRFVSTFLPRSKHHLISWLQSQSMILELKKIKPVTISIIPHLFAMKWWDQMPWSLFFECWVLRPLFHSPLSHSSRDSLIPLSFLPLGWCHLNIWGYWYFSWQSWFQLVLHPAWHFTWCTLHVSKISRVTIYSLDVLLFQFWTSPLLHVQF